MTVKKYSNIYYAELKSKGKVKNKQDFDLGRRWLVQ